MYNIRKINDPILRKLSDGRTDGEKDRQTDRQTDESDFIGRCSSNVERSKSIFFIKALLMMKYLNISQFEQCKAKIGDMSNFSDEHIT